MHTKQRHQYKVLLEFINETQLALMIQNPCVYPPDRFLVETCVITHHINFPGLLAFFIPLSPFHLFVFIFFSFFCSVDYFFGLAVQQNGLQLTLFFYNIIVISELLGLDPR